MKRFLAVTLTAFAAHATPVQPNIVLILAADRSEQHNLASQQPDRVRDMAASWQQLQDSFVRDAGVAVPNTTKKARP